MRDTMGERIVMEDLWFNNSTKSIDVYLRNTGKTAVHVSSVYVNHTFQSFTIPFNLEIGAHRWLNISRPWTSGSLYHVDIVTSRGTHVEGYHTAP
jgi:hypothetical protein